MYTVMELSTRTLHWEKVFEGTKSACMRFAKHHAGAHCVRDENGNAVWYC